MILPPSAIDLVKASEGFSPIVYVCPAGYQTFGYGSLLKYYPDMSFPITKEEGEDLLERELSRAAASVLRLTKVSLNDNQFAALIDFVYNLGGGRYQASTARTRINRGDYVGGAAILLKYVYGGGRILPGLVRRRKLEYDLFMG